MSGFAFIGQIINSLATGFQDDSTDGSYLRRPDNNLKWKSKTADSYIHKVILTLSLLFPNVILLEDLQSRNPVSQM